MTATGSFPARIGPYAVEGVLGAGGMGVVYRALAPDGTAVALKTLRADIADQDAARLVREGLVRVEHPNVVRVLATGSHGDAPYIVFELLDGESLEARLERGRIAPAEAVRVLAAACDGLEAVHAAGVVHRDVKPANIFLCADGAVKLLDFGVAQLAETSHLTVTGTVLGTPAYLAPEQARGQRDLDGRADVWAMGVVLHRALAGRSPFDRGSPYATLLAILLEEPSALRALAPDTPDALGAVAQRCLAKDPVARYASAAELALALRGADLSRTGDAGGPSYVTADEERVVAVLLAQGVQDRTAVVSALEAHGGVAVRVLGNDVVGLWGASTTEGDEAVRAVRAALAARHLADRVSVGSGRARSKGATLAGAGVRAAEQACSADVLGIAIDTETARLVGNRFSVEVVSEGLLEVVAERVEGTGSVTSAAAVPCLGRADELTLLEAAIAECQRDRRARLALVTGAPGAGKTHLASELEHRARSRPGALEVVTASAEPLGRETALGLFADALRARARHATATTGAPRIDAHAPPAERRQAVVKIVREALADPVHARESAQFLGVLAGVPMPETAALAAARQDPGLMSDRMRLALADWLAALCERGPVLLVLEDLHWADAASLRLVDELCERLESAPLFVLATARGDWSPSGASLFADREALRIDLRGLGEADVAELTRVTAGRVVEPRIVAAIARATDGNPLFVEQIVRTLRDGGSLDDDGELPMPLTVEAAIQARLDHLPSAEKELCKRASIFGRPFATSELEALGVEDAPTLARALCGRGLLAQTVTGHAFRSALTSEVAYRLMAPDVRRDLHRRAAAHLAKASAPEPEQVARHHDGGGEPEVAARWYALAASEGFARGDSLTVARCAGRALDLGAPSERRFELHLLRADAYRFLGEKRAWADDIERALAAATTDEDRARALTEKGAWLARAGRLEEAERVGADAVAAARRCSRPELLAYALARHAEALAHRGQFDGAEAAVAESERVVATSAPTMEAKVTAARALLSIATGDIGRARDAYERAIALHSKAGDVRRAVSNEQNLADVLNRVGAHAEAERALLVALDGARRVGNRLAEGYVLANLGYALAKQGRAAEALTVLGQAAERAAASGDLRLSLAIRVYRARALLAAGRVEEALADARSAADDGATHRQGNLEALARTALARAELASGDRDASAAAALRALELRDELGSVEEDEGELFATCVLCLRAAGRDAEATAVRARGRARIELLAGRIRDAAFARRFREDVESHRALAAEPSVAGRHDPNR